ncbi:MAG: hypothetical protein ACRYFS_16225 [Janthinobacterium lividum]
MPTQFDSQSKESPNWALFWERIFEAHDAMKLAQIKKVAEVDVEKTSS